jgi:hypothetical protein
MCGAKYAGRARSVVGKARGGKYAGEVGAKGREVSGRTATRRAK